MFIGMWPKLDPGVLLCCWQESLTDLVPTVCGTIFDATIRNRSPVNLLRIPVSRDFITGDAGLTKWVAGTRPGHLREQRAPRLRLEYRSGLWLLRRLK